MSEQAFQKEQTKATSYRERSQHHQSTEPSKSNVREEETYIPSDRIKGKWFDWHQEPSLYHPLRCYLCGPEKNVFNCKGDLVKHWRDEHIVLSQELGLNSNRMLKDDYCVHHANDKTDGSQRPQQRSFKSAISGLVGREHHLVRQPG